MGAALFEHLGEQGLQLIAFGRRALGLDHLVADHILNGSDQTNLCAEHTLEHLLEQVGGRRLAVGPGDADDGHVLRRVAEAVRTDHGESLARVLHREVVKHHAVHATMVHQHRQGPSHTPERPQFPHAYLYSSQAR